MTKKLCFSMLILLLVSIHSTIYAQTIPFTPENAEWIVQLNQIGDGYLNEFTYSPSGDDIVFAGSLGLWRLDATDSDATLQHLGKIALYSVTFNPTGTTLAAGSVDGHVEIWDVATWSLKLTIQVHTHAIRHVAFSPDGSRLAAIAGDRVKVLDVLTGETVHQLTGHTRPIYDVAYHPEGTQIATASFDDTVRIWDAETGEFVISISDSTDSVLCVTYNSEGNLVASSSYDGVIRIYNPQTGALLQTLTGQSEVNYNIVYSENGETLFALSQNNTLCNWDVGTGEVVETWDVPPVSEFTQHPDGRIILLNSYQNPVRMWDVQTDETLFTFDNFFLPPFHAMQSIDGELFTGAFDDSLWIWDINTWQLTDQRRGEIEKSDGIATTTDGQIVATALDNGDIALADGTGDIRATLVGHTMPVVGLMFTPDNTQLISVGSDGTIRVWGCGGDCPTD